MVGATVRGAAAASDPGGGPAKGAVRVSDLVTRLGVSDMTIRRDLAVLAGGGLVEKVYGGCHRSRRRKHRGTGVRGEVEQPSRAEGSDRRSAAGLVRPGTAIGISAGTSTWTLARVLGSVASLTVATNSTRVADV